MVVFAGTEAQLVFAGNETTAKLMSATMYALALNPDKRALVADRRELAGGLNTYGIAAYKTRVTDSLREVEMVQSLGVEFRQNVEVGRDISFQQLEKDFFPLPDSVLSGARFLHL